MNSQFRMEMPVFPGDCTISYPYRRYLEKSLDLETSKLYAEWWKIAPSFSVGWFSQSLDKVTGYTGWQYGISIPVWFWAPAGKIQYSRRSVEIARNNLEFERTRMSSRILKLRVQFERSRKTLDFYDNTVLAQAGDLIKTAETSYKAGEIDIFDYLVIVNQGFSIRFDYLDALNKYNQSVIQINKLYGK